MYAVPAPVAVSRFEDPYRAIQGLIASKLGGPACLLQPHLFFFFLQLVLFSRTGKHI
jgi:hypothetical protein